MTLCPARLEPVFSPRPWGTRSLAPFFPEMTNLAEPIGEAWMTGNESRFASGPFAGKKLAEVWPQMPPEWAGTNIERSGDFPLLVKFIFPQDKLSVQVHPDDEYAAKHEQAAGGRGKTEMWYAVDARPGAEVLVGLKSSVTREDFKRAIAEGSAENCLEHVPLRAGDAVFVPAGTAHTIGPGLVLCEIQQNSDLTYRVYDYNRRDAKGQSRPLHIEKALEVMRFGKQDGGRIEPLQTKRVRRKGASHALLLACPYFVVDKVEFGGFVRGAASHKHFDLLVVIDGTGEISWGDSDENIAEYERAQVWLIPAELSEYVLCAHSSTTFLRAYVPNDLDELNRELAKRGVSQRDGTRVVRR